MLLAGIGEDGQRRLASARVLLVGCGALGCAAADHLARAGVGRLTIVDRDVVELTNLQRQCLFDERDAAEGVPKAEAARRRIAAVNSGVFVEAVVTHAGPGNVEEFLRQEGGPLVIVDGTDNFETRLLLNDAAVKHGLPYVYGGVVAAQGMVMAVIPERTACLRCIVDELPPPGSMPTCDTAGVLGPAVAAVAAWQCAEAMKVIVGAEAAGGLLEFDLWRGVQRRVAVRPDPRCACCGSRRFDFLDGRDASSATTLCGAGAVQVLPARPGRVDLAAVESRLGPHGTFTRNAFLLRGRLDRERGDDGADCELTVFADGRAVVRGVKDHGRARAVYDRYVGG